MCSIDRCFDIKHNKQRLSYILCDMFSCSLENCNLINYIFNTFKIPLVFFFLLFYLRLSEFYRWLVSMNSSKELSKYKVSYLNLCAK